MWTYHQSNGRMFDKDGVMLAIGYSGFGAGLNNPAMQNVPDVGPIPQGLYTIEPPHDSPHTGPYTLALTPDPANEMYGRSAIECHGDNSLVNHTASHGCVILPRFARERIWESGDHQLTVTA